MTLARLDFLVGVASAGAASAAATVTLPFTNGTRPLVAYPQKRPLIVLTPRPPQLEPPFAVLKRICD